LPIHPVAIGQKELLSNSSAAMVAYRSRRLDDDRAVVLDAIEVTVLDLGNLDAHTHGDADPDGLSDSSEVPEATPPALKTAAVPSEWDSAKPRPR